MNIRAAILSIVLAAYSIGAHAQEAKVPDSKSTAILVGALARNPGCAPKDFDQPVALRCAGVAVGGAYSCAYAVDLTCPAGDKSVYGTLKLSTPENRIVDISFRD